MKFKKFNHETHKDWIYLLPSVEVNINNPIYYYNNLAISNLAFSVVLDKRG